MRAEYVSKKSVFREKEVIYLGFSVNPNKGLTFTTNETVLFRDAEIVNAVKKAKKKPAKK